MQIWKKLGLTVVLCVLSAGMTVNAGFTGSNVHSAGQSMGVGGLLEESMDPEACLEAAQNAKETRKKIYGYENLGVAKVNDYLNIRKDPSENGELVGKLPKNGGADVLSEENGWYKIKSGKVTGYVRADYMVTGEEACGQRGDEHGGLQFRRLTRAGRGKSGCAGHYTGSGGRRA